MSISVLLNSHSDARSRAEAEGKITHRTLKDIAQQIFQAVIVTPDGRLDTKEALK